jgi:hypothetical protein
MSAISPKRLRVFSAWCCLLAALALFAPFAEAAWNAHAAACCTGDHCPIPEHHHHSRAPEPAADCEHHRAGMMACQMSCCESSNHYLLASLAFVLPFETAVTGLKPFRAHTAALQPDASPRFFEVLAPPPRLSLNT